MVPKGEPERLKGVLMKGQCWRKGQCWPASSFDPDSVEGVAEAAACSVLGV